MLFRSIGNRLWRDDNGNGIQDAGEPGIANVLLELANDQSKIVGRDTTDINGVYSFNHFNVVDTVGVLKPHWLFPKHYHQSIFLPHWLHCH